MPRKKQKPNRADNRYEIKVTVGRDINGKAIRKSFYSKISIADCHVQAEEYILKKKVEEKCGLIDIDENDTFEDWARIYLNDYKKGKKSYNTTYKIPVENHLIPHFGKAPINSIKPIHIQQFFKKNKNKFALEYMKKMRGCLRGIFEIACENDACLKNPITRTLELESTIPEPVKRTYSKDQVIIILTFADTHEHGLDIILLLQYGLTRSELLGIRWSDIDYKKKIIHVRQGTTSYKDSDTEKWVIVSDGLKNKYRFRDLPVDDYTLKKIKEKPKVISVNRNKKITEFLIYNSKGEAYDPQNWYKRVYKTFMGDLREKYPSIPYLTPHELRHTVATLMKDEGMDLFSLARLLGHRNLDMLAKRYAHDNVETIRKAMEPIILRA